MTITQIQSRIATLEKQVAAISKQLSTRKTGKWWIDDAGRFANDSVFDEIVAAGRAYRESTRPKRSVKKRKTRAGA